MDQEAVIKLCKELGCCGPCCLRYLGLKNPKAFENSQEFIKKISSNPVTQSDNSSTSQSEALVGTEVSTNDSQEEPAPKKRKVATCVSCLGILQEHTWPECVNMVKDALEKKRYECSTFACALSSPITTLLREKVITLRISETVQGYDPQCVTPLKEAWKWSFAVQLAQHIDKTLDSGAVSPLLITLNMEYADDLQELEILKSISPTLFESRSKQKRRFHVEFTRRCVEQALEGATLEQFGRAQQWAAAVPAATQSARYIKLSRELPQTPWVLNGKRMMESSVQEIIFEPIARLYNMTPEEVEHRLKFMSAGREDVDVRCLGDGRPFAIEVTDPHRELNPQELQQTCEDISSGGKVIVKLLVPVTRDELAELKKGEETKCKTYEALCIKLSHSEHDTSLVNGACGAISVSDLDIARINSYRNTPPGDEARVLVAQRTPVRVLHRRPLLTRTRRIYDLSAQRVPGHPQLVAVSVRTEAGTYVKEWVHGELRRTRPSLGHAARARLDILALDVTTVHLDWPRTK